MSNELPKIERAFDFEEKGEITGKKYDGQFLVKSLLNFGDKHQLELQKTLLQADTRAPTPGLRGIAQIIAELGVRVVNAPTWWEQSNGGRSIVDENVVLALYDKVLEQEDEWKKELALKQAETVEETPDPNLKKES